jgi:hypothetical protein
MQAVIPTAYNADKSPIAPEIAGSSRWCCGYDRAVSAVLDDSFYPILLSSMTEPVVREEVEAYFHKLIQLADAAIGEREKYVVIVTSDVTKFTAASRKLVADAQARFMTAARDSITLSSYVPIDNALVRGAATALRWIAPEIVKTIRFVPSLKVALDEALAALEANGTPYGGDRPALRRALGIRA